VEIFSAGETAAARPLLALPKESNMNSTQTNKLNMYLAVQAVLDYGITPAKLTALKKKTDAFQSVQVKPRQGRATSSAATKALPELFALADAVLNDRLDGLMIQFKDSQPTLFHEYTSARIIVDLPGGRASKEIKVAANTNLPKAA
jgi:hypothetical protein